MKQLIYTLNVIQTLNFYHRFIYALSDNVVQELMRFKMWVTCNALYSSGHWQIQSIYLFQTFQQLPSQIIPKEMQNANVFWQHIWKNHMEVRVRQTSQSKWFFVDDFTT